MSNTVDALKNLYKTLCGSDYAGDPNPTDAEMIDAIARDASSGGDVSSSEEIIVDITEADPSAFDITIKSGLSKSEAMQILFKTNGVDSVYYLQPSSVVVDLDYPAIYELIIEFESKRATFLYYPESGRLTTVVFVDPEDPSHNA